MPRVPLGLTGRPPRPPTRQSGLDDVLDALDDVLPLSSALATTLLLVGIGGPEPHTRAGAADVIDLVIGAFRRDDWVGELSVEEVAVILAGTADDAQSAAARVLRRIDSAGCRSPVVIGIVALTADLTADEALARAADAVTVARVVGSRRIVHHHPPLGATTGPGESARQRTEASGLDVLLPPGPVGGDPARHRRWEPTSQDVHRAGPR